MLKSALLVTAGIIVGAGAIHGLHAAGSPPVYSIAEINVKDRAAYEKELPAVLKAIKDGGGVYIAGGFDRATLDYGSPPIGNRVSVIRYESRDAYDKVWNTSVKKWIDDINEKGLAGFRVITVNGVEAK